MNATRHDPSAAANDRVVAALAWRRQRTQYGMMSSTPAPRRSTRELAAGAAQHAQNGGATTPVGSSRSARIELLGAGSASRTL